MGLARAIDAQPGNARLTVLGGRKRTVAMRLLGRGGGALRRRQAMAETWWRHRVRLGLPLGIVYVWLARPGPHALEIGGAIALAGLGLRAVSAGHLRKNAALATSGPYAATRNPLYLGSLLIALGFLIAGRSLLADALAAVYFAAFYHFAIVQEENKLHARFGASFDEYAARVPRLWPRPRGRVPESAHFSWRLYWRNREYQAALGFMAGVAVLWLKMHFRA